MVKRKNETKVNKRSEVQNKKNEKKEKKVIKDGGRNPPFLFQIIPKGRENTKLPCYQKFT